MPRVTRRILLPAILASVVLLYLYLPASSFLPTSSSSPRTMHSSPDATGQRPLRLAILEADTPQPQAQAKYHGYGGVFKSLLTQACKILEPPQTLEQQFTVSAHDVVNDMQSYPALDDIDAILISGSRHNSFDGDAWILKLVEYTRKALATDRIRIVGICFGHQIVGRAVGAKVGKSDKGWEVAVTEVDLTDKGKKIFGLDKMRIHQMHRDIVFDFPSGAVPLGGNGMCAVQAMYHPGRYITVQGHPEFTNDIVAEVLTNRHKSGVFDDAMFKDGMSRTPLEHDGVKIAKAFIHFLRE